MKELILLQWRKENQNKFYILLHIIMREQIAGNFNTILANKGLTVKEMKKTRKELTNLKREVANETKELRKWTKWIWEEIKKAKARISENTKKKPRKPKEVIQQPSVVQEVEAPAIDPVPQEELQQTVE